VQTVDRRSLCALALLALVTFPPAAANAGRDAGRPPVRKLGWSELASRPGGQQAIDREVHRQRVHHERRHVVHDLLGGQQISAKSLGWLAERGLGAARFEAPFAPAVKADPDTLRILLVRIAFDANRDPELVTMAPDGDFFFEPRFPDAELQIDPEPHDRAYFEAHLRGLSEFYRFQSGGRLVIESRVLPDDERGSYRLGDVADYGPGAGDFWTLDGLEAMVRDMITAADEGTQADGSVDLGDFDDDDPLTYIIFAHAGSDWQSDIAQDTPNDIPTFFVTLGEPQALTSGSLTECSVIPETTTQDGYKGSIAAALYHEFGHALGLPDVYDATTGLTSVGVWDLMDSGTNLAAVIGYEDPDTGELVGEAVTGILPPSLSAWCKWFLGWVVTDLVPGGTGGGFQLPAVGVSRETYAIHNEVAGNRFDLAQPQVLVGGASSREFFLVENRWIPLSVEDTPFDPYDPESNYGGLYFLSDDHTGLFPMIAGDRRGTTGINTGYYDYFLPEVPDVGGGGLLVWHVNLDRIESGLADNTINRYGDGLKLVEADGIQDIGVLDAYVLGWYGSELDPFSPWNPGGYRELFAEGTGVPTSRAFDRSWTGLHLWDIADDGAAHGAVMALQAAVEPLAEGWPLALPPAGDVAGPAPRALDPQSLTPLLGTDGRALVFGVDAPLDGEPPLLFAWTSGGEPAYAGAGDLPEGAVATLADRLAGPPAALADSDGLATLLVGTCDGAVTAWRPGAALEPLWSASVGDSLLAGPQPVALAGGSWLVLAIDGEGYGHLVDEDGEAVGDPAPLMDLAPSRPVCPLRVLQLAGGPAVLVATAGGWRLRPIGPAGFESGAANWSGRLEEPAAVAAVPVAEGWRLVIFGPQGGQGSWRIAPDGAWTIESWPDPGAALAGEPAVADLDGDGHFDLIAATGGRLFAWQDDGTPLTGFPADLAALFPLPDSTRVGGPVVVADLAGGPGNELAFSTAGGHLFVLDARGRPTLRTPLRFGGGGPSGLILAPLDGEGASLALADAGGRLGAPLERRLTNGRLALCAGRALPAGGPATAGWFGPGGGPARSGPVGVARPVAGQTPADLGDDRAVFYPNPLVGTALTVRFWSATDRPADLAIYNLQGETVLALRIPTSAGRINEHTVDLDVASGLYLARLTSEQAAGKVQTEFKTVAVAR